MSKSSFLPIALSLLCTPPLLAQSGERHEREWSAKVEKMATRLLPAMREHGVIGHVVKERTEERGIGEGIKSSIYPHAQGNWVHGAGAWVSFDWPERYGRHPREPVRGREIWSIEYSASLAADEWDGQEVTMFREEDAWVDDDGTVRYFAGPQDHLWLIRSE